MFDASRDTSRLASLLPWTMDAAIPRRQVQQAEMFSSGRTQVIERGESLVRRPTRRLIRRRGVADRLVLYRRVRRATTVTEDGSQTVEETEERNLASPSEPLRVVQRILTTLRRTKATRT